MIIITVGPEKELDPSTDPLGRSRAGYSSTMSERDIYEGARWAWVLGPRAHREKYALVAHEGHIVQAIQIDRLVPADRGRMGIEGKILRSGHEVYDAYVDKPSPVPPQRNPIRYFDAPIGHRKCRCGCGQTVALGDFVTGHDQRALHDRVRQIGTVAEFIDWFDRVRLTGSHLR